MLKRFHRHLLMLNACVFISVLIIFSSVVYGVVSKTIDDDERQDLQVMTDTIVNSLDPSFDARAKFPSQSPEELIGAKGNPDAIKASVQWFDTEARKQSENGSLAVNHPFSPDAQFQTQAVPHALLLTRDVRRSGKLFGYVRVGVALVKADDYKSQLLFGLVCGTALAFLASCLAITWLVQQSLKPVEESIRKLAQFGADASHELKSPLMAIKTNATVALKYADSMREKDREKFELILSAADQMDATTSGLLHLARFDHRLNQKELTVIELAPLLQEIIDELKATIDSKQILVSTNSKSADLDVRARKDDLKIVFKNVIENAIRYSKPNGHVTVNSMREGAKLKIEVVDDGIGISDEDLPKVFDRFWRSDKARKHTDGGSGLGLSIVESIVARYGGSVAIKSRLGEGTSFTIVLPEG
jgi:OmpR-family two-component system manganese-sensing sensor histidine kinase